MLTEKVRHVLAGGRARQLRGVRRHTRDAAVRGRARRLHRAPSARQVHRADGIYTMFCEKNSRKRVSKHYVPMVPVVSAVYC